MCTDTCGTSRRQISTTFLEHLFLSYTFSISPSHIGATMAKSQRHKRIASKKAKKAHQEAKARQVGAPKRWTRDPSWRDSKEPKATFQQVVDTFELLENVLNHLPPQDLLHVQEACFKIKSTVEQSQILRQKLFLEADDSYKPLWKLIHARVESHDQPIEVLQGGQQDYIDPETGFEIRYEDTAQTHQVFETTRIPRVINPLILEIFPHFGRMRNHR